MRLFLRFFSAVLLGWCTNAIATPTVHVAVAQIVEHPALDTLRQGLKEGLEAKGYKEGETLIWTYENAQGNPTTAIQIGHKLVSLQPTVIVTLSTPMAQATASATNTIPIVFGAVTDPSAAKLTNHANITGLTDFVPPEKQLELIRKILPNLKTIGVIYNSGEANSRKQVEALKAVADPLGIIVVEATVSKTSDVSSVAKSLVGRVNAIVLPTDNTVISALESILKIGSHHKIPVFGSDVDIVRRGATAAYGVDWQESGRDLAEIVASILRGEPAVTLSIQHPKGLLLHINRHAAKKMGVTLSEDLQKEANKVF